MFLRFLRRSVHITGPIVLGVVLLSTATHASAAADTACLQAAARERTNALLIAYNEYTKGVQRAVQDLGDREVPIWNNTDRNFRQNELNQANAAYTASVNATAQRLTDRMHQIWNDYRNRQASCMNGGGYAVDAYGYANAYNGSRYVGSVSGYASPYGYDGYYGNGNPYNDYYATGYPYGCGETVLPAAPAGCGYDCRVTNDGCRRCQVSCRRTGITDCGCAGGYQPVCGRDGMTYTNECFARCVRMGVVYAGICQH